jgi:hypothetical protein
LCSTKENSLLFSSSYENINRIANNTYIKDFNLQNKIKTMIINELNNKETNEPLKKTSTNNQLQHFSTHTSEIHINSNKNNAKAKFSGTVIQQPFNRSSSLKRLALKSKSIKNDISNDKSEKSLSIVKNENRRSIFALKNNYKLKGGGDSPNKSKRKISKKKLVKVKKKLSVISKNIENTNNAINNPNEFYMNFFNDIIRKETFVIKNDEDKDEKKEPNLSNNSLYSQK